MGIIIAAVFIVTITAATFRSFDLLEPNVFDKLFNRAEIKRLRHSTCK